MPRPATSKSATKPGAAKAPAVAHAAKIRVATYDGPGADPVIREVPWPKVPAARAR